MVDILVRDVDAETARRLKQKAADRGASVAETAREALRTFVKPTKKEAWAEIDRIRKKIGRVAGDSTDDIRAHRDNNERYR